MEDLPHKMFLILNKRITLLLRFSCLSAYTPLEVPTFKELFLCSLTGPSWVVFRY